MALNPLRRIFLNLQKVASYHANYNSIIENGESPSSFWNYKRLQLKLRVFLAGHILPMVTYCATKLTATCYPMIGQFVDTMMLASTSTEW